MLYDHLPARTAVKQLLGIDSSLNPLGATLVEFAEHVEATARHEEQEHGEDDASTRCLERRFGRGAIEKSARRHDLHGLAAF